MNEKIKELLAKHVSPPNLAVDRDDQGQHTAHVTYTVGQAEMNTLLSAVIRECALQCIHNEDMDLIEKHFGVTK